MFLVNELFPQTLISFSYAIIGGLLPALLWLWFWLHEDQHPEPTKLIIYTFLFGMLGVLVSFPIEKYFASIFKNDSFEVFWYWAMTEEVIKYLVAWLIALRTKVFDEPIDAFVYLTTAALGFAALENTFFIWKILSSGETLVSVLTGDMRFLGASLLHVVTSGTLAIFIGLSYYKKSSVKVVATSAGLILAIALHTLFNFSIIVSTGIQAFMIFASVWLAIIIIIFLLEKTKSVVREKI